MTKWIKLTVLCMLLVSSSGCTWMWPDWRHPGNIMTQRSRATLHDPYADTEAGPEVVGGRPREYQQPLSEADRSRYVQENVIWGGRTP